MNKHLTTLCLAGLTLFTLTSLAPWQERDNTLSRKEKKEGWILLFDGNTLNGWRYYKNRPGDGWSVQNGELVCLETGVKQRGDLITDAMYENFELQIDWKIAPRHNSGIIYHCTEENGASFESGPEYQLIDDTGYPDKLHDKQLSGSNYDMHAPTSAAVKPAGEYNRTRIIVQGAHVEHWLNDVKVVEYELWSPDWEQAKAISKWKTVGPYGMSTKGHIALQDHGGGVSFKNIKMKVR